MRPRKHKKVFRSPTTRAELPAAGRCRASQPYPEMTVDSAWWLGGWHDCDMELSDEPKNYPIAAAAQAA